MTLMPGQEAEDVRAAGLSALAAAAMPAPAAPSTAADPPAWSQPVYQSLFGVGYVTPAAQFGPPGAVMDSAGNPLYDDAIVINYVLTQRGVVQLGPYPYNLLTPIAAQAGTLQGAGQDLTIADIAAGFTGPAAILITTSQFLVRDLHVTGTLNGATRIDGIQFTGCQATNVSDVNFTGINGLCVKGASSGSVFIADTKLSRLNGRNCAGGIQLDSTLKSGNNGECFLTDMQFQEMGAASGPAVGLDVFLFSNIQDVLGENFNCGFASSAVAPGAALHLTGNAGACEFTNLDLGAPLSGGYSIQVDAGSPNNLLFTNFSGGAVLIDGSSHRIILDSGRISGSETHGLEISSNGFGIEVSKVQFHDNGQGAAGSNYDVYWHGTAHGLVTDCLFEDTPVSVGTAGVQGNVYLASAHQSGVYFDGNIIPDTSNAFVNGSPRYNRTLIATGTATLTGGTAAVSISLVSAQSRIRVDSQAPAGSPGALYVSAVTPGVSFQITSTSGGDTSAVAWEITT